MTRLSQTSTAAATLLTLLLLAAPARVHAEDDIEEAVGGEESALAERDASSGQTLADRIPSVTRRVFLKQGRVELFPAIGTTVNDPFFDHLVVSGGLIYHVMESVAIGFTADYYQAFATELQIAGSAADTPVSFASPRFGARVDASWAPIYGKLSLMAEHVLHFDTYALVGAGIMSDNNSSTRFAGSVGIGQRYFVADGLAIRIEARDQMYQMNRFPSGPGKADWQHLISLSVAACFYFPSTFQREAL